MHSCLECSGLGFPYTVALRINPQVPLVEFIDGTMLLKGLRPSNFESVRTQASARQGRLLLAID